MSPDPNDQFGTPRPMDPREIEYARQSVRIPAILLIVIGVIGTILSTLGWINLPNVPAKMDEMIAKFDDDPNIAADQKDTIRKILTSLKEAAEDGTARTSYIIGILGSLLIVVGGYKLLTLGGVALPITGSLLAMVPCTANICCLLGLPVGIWAMIALNRQVVRNAIRVKRTSPANPDAQYMQ